MSLGPMDRTIELSRNPEVCSLIKHPSVLETPQSEIKTVNIYAEFPLRMC